jgi:hypothetical protein
MTENAANIAVIMLLCFDSVLFATDFVPIVLEKREL